MKKVAGSIYHSRTETDEQIIIVWKPFLTYCVYVLLVIEAVLLFFKLFVFSPIPYVLMFINVITYLVMCKDVRREIKEASKMGVSLSGNKFSISHPFTVTIKKNASDMVMFCRKCGRNLVDNSKFCGNCGTEIITKVEGTSDAL